MKLAILPEVGHLGGDRSFRERCRLLGACCRRRRGTLDHLAACDHDGLEIGLGGGCDGYVPFKAKHAVQGRRRRGGVRYRGRRGRRGRRRADVEMVATEIGSPHAGDERGRGDLIRGCLGEFGYLRANPAVIKLAFGLHAGFVRVAAEGGVFRELDRGRDRAYRDLEIGVRRRLQDIAALNRESDDLGAIRAVGNRLSVANHRETLSLGVRDGRVGGLGNEDGRHGETNERRDDILDFHIIRYLNRGEL